VSLGFAIPAATAVDVAEQLLADGTATHPYLGLTPARTTPQLQEAFGLPARDGVLVLRVDPDGPAAAAGIRPGDVLMALGDRSVPTVGDLLDALRDAEPGQQMPITVARDDNGFTGHITLGSVSG
jgi:serine protease Do